MERLKPLLLSLGLSLFFPTGSAYAVMYKWYDEQGHVNYTQTPPPKGSTMAPINTDTFNAIEMRKAPAIQRVKAKAPQKRATKPRAKPKQRKTRSSCSRRKTR
ncbi:MAG: DUF4124 domain-containing protein [Candidatus Thiodiazotropha sp.]